MLKKNSVLPEGFLAMILVACLSLSPPIHADGDAAGLQEAGKAVRTRDFSRAITLYQEVAVAGNAEAQFQLANLYLNGHGDSDDETEALAWLQRAADQDHPGALYTLAMRLMTDDETTALVWMEKAALLGNSSARRYLEKNRNTSDQHARDTLPEDKQTLVQYWFAMAGSGETEKLAEFLDRLKNVNVRDASNRTALFAAIEHDKPEAVQWLLAHKADQDAVDDFGIRPLFLAIQVGSAPVLKQLLDAGAKTAITLPNGNSLLHQAILQNQVDLAGLLLEAGAPANLVNEGGWTALDLASERSDKPLVDKLTKYRAGHGDKWKTEQLHTNRSSRITNLDVLAAERFDEPDEVARLVVENNKELLMAVLEKQPAFTASQLQDGSTLLFLAVELDRQEITRLLLQHGADPNQGGRKGMTAVQLAARENRVQILMMLLQDGGDPLLIDETGLDSIDWAINHHSPATGTLVSWVRKNTPISTRDVPFNRYLLRAVQTDQADVVELLLPNAGKETADELGRNALWHAANNANAALVSRLLDAGISNTRQDSLGQSPLYMAVTSGCLACVESLSAGADINVSTVNGNSPLIAAAGRNYPAVVAWLLQHGAKVDLRNNKGDTALIAAAETGMVENIGLLLEAGAKVGRKNNLGVSALQIAEQNNPEIYRLLQQRDTLRGLF